LERDALPRYKTCGGGLVGRAVALLPPEVERVLERRCGQADLHLLDVNQHYRATRDPPSVPIMAMTMRERLDHMVASAAAAAGAALRTRRGAINLHGQLEEYLRVIGLAPQSLERHGFVIPVRPRAGPLARERMLLVGDAAGFADPVTAEGISFAAQSGKLAADA